MTDKESPPYAAPEEIVQAVMRAARAMRRGLEIAGTENPDWDRAILEGLRRTTPAEREALRVIHSRILALIDAADRER